jgi:hypothetical protein
MARRRVKAHLPEPSFHMSLANWDDDACVRHPVSIWKVIGICTTYGWPLPVEVLTYLFEVAERMEKARGATDLESVLPAILGFPKRKRGPGKPLADPHKIDWGKLDFAIPFGIELKSDPKISIEEALERAAGPSSSAHVRTMKRWIVNALALNPKPRTAPEWRAAVEKALEKVDIVSGN